MIHNISLLNIIKAIMILLSYLNLVFKETYAIINKVALLKEGYVDSLVALERMI